MREAACELASAYDAPRLPTRERTLRIGIVIDRWQPSRGGAEGALAALARHLESRGHDVVALAERGVERGPGRMRLVTRRSAWTRGGRVRAFADAALGAAEAERCDVTIGVRHLARVDLYWPHGGSHARSLAAHAAARAWRPGAAAGIPLREPHGRHRTFVALERALLEAGGARRVACVSASVERELAQDFPASRARLVRIENGVDLERFRPRSDPDARTSFRRSLGLDARAAVVTFCARQPILKGLPVLLAALARIPRTPWTLVVAGTPDLGTWRRRAQAAGIVPERLRVLAEADSARLFAASDLLAHPTWRDTSGLVLLEALAAGVPVITTTAAGEADTVRAAGGSVIDRPGDEVALARELARLFDVVRAGTIDPSRIRGAVASRGLDAWLARLEREVVELAT